MSMIPNKFPIVAGASAAFLNRLITNSLPCNEVAERWAGRLHYGFKQSRPEFNCPSHWQRSPMLPSTASTCAARLNSEHVSLIHCCALRVAFASA